MIESHGSDRVESRFFQISRVGAGQEVMKSSRVGLGHDPPETGHSRVGSTWHPSCLGCQSTGRVRGSKSWVEINSNRPAINPYFTGQPKSVGSGQIGSGQEIFKSHGSGRARPDLTREVRPDPRTALIYLCLAPIGRDLLVHR